MDKVEKVARAIKELKPFEDGNENVEYILIRGLSAIGFQLPAAGAQDLAEDIARAALAAAEAGEQPSLASYVSPNVYDGVRASPPSEASRDERDAIRKEAFEEAARIADNGALVPPDGGSPTQDECDVAERIATAIRARGET